ncbi:hypothetical protein C499_02359 [Halogeometricum borinquense DSM 11551]|uniref:Uncharacterized protein n=2 Tax=Halogeometricum borinquense TaxID=60847 RepID=E4NPS9_HALBP|nr:hypothetical protein [Halogeometricum borinquense]ADQ66562.1 hypothetical protein Hbor_09680 [Halogeometricum borinquense DSM 11551]ELY30670.1 hypothetical protein C499_02359 [Halogeometricum borinquense DSM 11551]RYJ15414.1 hypothetical protein ELS19_10955 [Halogeometricum borinquense]
MSPSKTTASWFDPKYVATVVGVLAAGALVFYSTLTRSGPTVEEITFVLLAVTLPATVAYEVTRRIR